MTTATPALEAEADVELADGGVDLLAEAAGADHAGDDDHGQGEHDDLVDAGHDRRQGERQLDAQQGAARAWCRTPRRPRPVRRRPAGCPARSCGRPGASAKMRVATKTGGGADAEEEDRRDQVDERRHRLHDVQHRPQLGADPRRLRAAQMPSGTANTRAMTVATRTSESVSIASSHSSSESIRAKPAKASAPASRPRSQQAMHREDAGQQQRLGARRGRRRCRRTCRRGRC